MIVKAEGFEKYILAAGFKDVCIDRIDQTLNSARKMVNVSAVQLFDAKLIGGEQHLLFAALNALKAFRNQTNISKNLAVECLLYACAQRQIRVALNLIGVTKTSTEIAVLIVADEKQDAETALREISRLILGKRDDAVLKLSNEKAASIKRLFGISDLELEATRRNKQGKEALQNSVIEHIALLVTRR
ncbi:MAG: hypothetical protein JSW72_01315 [Candidatus Bathyarchaeota archaeon]|nr:MAG: hypothetical protein JSW72_01315 [Candidatus Bathyarchaeota archaeon]